MRYWALVDIVHPGHTSPLLQILSRAAWSQRVPECERATIISQGMSQTEALTTLWRWRTQLGCRGLNYRVLPADPP